MSSARAFTRRVTVPLILAGTAVAALAALPASADTTHVIARGHTIETIAHRYHVTVKAILDANHLKDTKHLKPGDTLIIPGVTPPPAKKDDKHAGGKKDDKHPTGATGKGEGFRPGAPAAANEHKGETPN